MTETHWLKVNGLKGTLAWSLMVYFLLIVNGSMYDKRVKSCSLGKEECKAS